MVIEVVYPLGWYVIVLVSDSNAQDSNTRTVMHKGHPHLNRRVEISVLL